MIQKVQHQELLYYLHKVDLLVVSSVQLIFSFLQASSREILAVAGHNKYQHTLKRTLISHLLSLLFLFIQPSLHFSFKPYPVFSRKELPSQLLSYLFQRSSFLGRHDYTSTSSA